jgi:hypothetical protein
MKSINIVESELAIHIPESVPLSPTLPCAHSPSHPPFSLSISHSLHLNTCTLIFCSIVAALLPTDARSLSLRVVLCHLMLVPALDVLDRTQSPAGHTHQRTRRRARGRRRYRPPVAWTERHRANMCVDEWMSDDHAGRVQGLIQIHCAARTKEVERLRFSDKDLNVIGTLERGQFGVVCFQMVSNVKYCV